MDKRLGGVLAIAGLTASVLMDMGTVGAVRGGDLPVHLRDAPVMSESGESPFLASAHEGAGAGAETATEIEVRGDDAAIRDAVTTAGGVVLGEAPGALHARLPSSATEALQAHPGVDSIRPAPELHPATTSEGVASTGAAGWHGGGTDGAGVDVAIIDGGFYDHPAAVLAGELPAGTQTAFSACVESDLTDHGTAVAEVVHDMAPGATLHLICIDSAFDVDAASDPTMAYLRTHDIEVANASFGFSTLSRGDGQGDVDRAVSQSRRDGTLWTVSAGNEAQVHSRVPKGASLQRIVDTSGSFFVDAVDLSPGAGTDRWMGFMVAPGDGNPDTAEIVVEAKWDSWASSSRIDFDLWAFTAPTLAEQYLVTGSFVDQSAGSELPIEGFGLSNPSASPRMFYLMIDAYQPGAAPIDLYFHNADAIEHPVAAGSVAEPGSSPGAFTVGAACVHNNALEPFSSQGPTLDGRVKPDIVAPDGTDSSVYGEGSTCIDAGFYGTSASAPHVAGAAALVLHAQPGLDAGEVQAILERRAIPAGAPGKDSLWGWGQLALGAADAPGAPAGDRYGGLSPSARLVDTRTASAPLGSGATRRFVVAGTNGVPADATAVVLNLTAVKPTASGYLTAFPAGAARPVASNLNFGPGAVLANSVTVGLGTNGSIDLFNYAGSTHVVIDIAGWYGPSATAGLATVAPVRAVDTRPGTQTRIAVPGGGFGGTEVLRVQLAGNPAILEVPATAGAVVLNATVTGPTNAGHLTVWPAGLAKPLASSINFGAGSTLANLVIAKVGTDGQVDLAISTGQAHAILDIVGYYDGAAPGRFVALPTVHRIADSRTGNGGPVAPIGAGLIRQVEATSLHGVPLDATGVVVNLTAVSPTAASGHLTAWGTGPTPTASTLNFTKGAIVGNAAIVGIGPSGALVPGRLGLRNSAGSTHVILDLAGYFVAGP